MPVNLLDPAPSSSPVNLLAPPAPSRPPVNLLESSSPPVNLLAPTPETTPNLNGVHPVSQLPIWAHMANEEIRNTPGLTNDLANPARFAVMQKWGKAAETQRINPNPHYLGLETSTPLFNPMGEPTVAPEELGSGPVNAFRTGATNATLSAYGLVAPKSALELRRGVNTRFAYEPGFINNRLADAGGALPALAAQGVGGPTGGAILGAAQGAGEARMSAEEQRQAGHEVSGGAELAGATLQGLRGGVEGYAQGKLLGGAGKLASRIENPILRAATAGGIDVAGNSLLAAPSAVAGNAIAKATYDPNRDLTEGVGGAMQGGAVQGLMFAPASIHHAGSAHEINRQQSRLSEVIGADHPAVLTNDPKGSDARAAHELAMASTGKAPVWFASDSPRRAFLDPRDNRIYLNADSPKEALEESMHALFRGELKPHLEKFAADNPDVVGMAADNYAGRAENAGETGIAAKVRSDVNAHLDEGIANTGVAGMTPEAIANIAKTNPGAFMRAYERVLGVIDKITGGNRAAGRLVERQMKQFIDPLRANVDVAREALSRENKSRLAEEALDADEANRAKTSENIPNPFPENYSKNTVNAGESSISGGKTTPNITQKITPPASPENHQPKPVNAPAQTAQEQQAPARDSRAESALTGTMAHEQEDIPAPGKTPHPPSEKIPAQATPPAGGVETSAPVPAPAESAAGKGAGEKDLEKTEPISADSAIPENRKTPDLQTSKRGPVSIEPVNDRYFIVKGTPKHPNSIFGKGDGLGGNWDAKREGYVFSKTRREEVEGAVNKLNSEAEKPPLGQSDSMLSKSPSEPAETPAAVPVKIETDATAGGPNPSDHPVEHQADDRRADRAQAGDAAGTEAGQPPKEPGPRQVEPAAKPGELSVSEDKTTRGRTSFEVSAGGNSLTVEQERPGSKTWRVTRKGQTIGEVSRATNKTLGGGLTRDEAQQTAESILKGQAAKAARAKPLTEEPRALRDLPDDEIPFSIREGKAVAQNEHGTTEKAVEEEAKAPLPQRVSGAVARVMKGIKNLSPSEAIPRLNDAGLGDAAWAHAAARDAAPYVVRDMISQTLPQEFRDEKVAGEMTDVMLMNRYLGAYDAAVAAGDDARARSIANANPLETFDKKVKAYWNDPAGRARIERYNEAGHSELNKMFQTVKGAGEVADFRAPRQGRYFDAYVPIMGEVDGPQAAHAEDIQDIVPANNVLNANVKRDPFDKRAKYVSSTRSTDLEALLTAVVTPRLREMTKLQLYKEMIAKGVAVEPSIENEKPAAIQGKPAANFTIDWPEYNPDTRQTKIVRKPLYVRADLVRELRGVLNTDMRPEPSAVANALNSLQIMGIADGFIHTKNMAARLLMSQGKGSPLGDVVKSNPVIGIPRTMKEMFDTWRELQADSPDLRSELAEMAKQGLLRGEPEHQGPIGKLVKWAGEKTGIEWMKSLGDGSIMHELDKVSRLILKRRHDELVSQGRAPDTVEDRRDFVMNLGNYNRQTMQESVRWLKDKGISAFISAGLNYNRSARELVTGNPGFAEKGTRQQRINARMVQLGSLASVAATAVLGNYLLNGTATGRSGTPLGAIDLGGDDKDGTHATWDLLQIAGLRRGLRAIGADAVIEGERQGKDANTIAGNAVSGALQSALHPWVGPAPSFIFKAMTGKQLDIRGKMEAQTIPEGGGKQYLENLRAATESQNPLLYSLTRPFFQAAGLDHKTADEEKGFLGGIGSALAKIPAQAAGVKNVQAGKDAAEDMADRLAKAHFGSASMTPEDAGKFALRTSLLSKLKSDPENGQAEIEQAVADGKLSEREAANLHKKAGMSGLAWNVKSLGATDAAKVYEAGTDEEKDALRDTLVDKIAASKELSSGQQDKLLEELGIDPPEDLAMRRELHGLASKAKAYNDARKKAQAGDRTARAQLSSLRMSGKDQARLSRLQNLSRAIKKAKGEGQAGASKVKRLVAAA